MTKSQISAMLCVLALVGCGAAGDPVAPGVKITAEAQAGVVVK